MLDKFKDNIKLLISVITITITITLISFIIGASIRYYEISEMQKDYEMDKKEIRKLIDDVKELQFNEKLRNKDIDKLNESFNSIFYYKYPYGQWGSNNYEQ